MTKKLFNNVVRLPIFLVLLTLAISYFAIGSVNAQALIWTATSNPSGLTDVAANVAVGPTGVYVVGYDMVGGNARWRIERRSPANGALLAAVTINPSGGSDVANGVAVDGTGVYVVGYDKALGNERWRIEKRSLLGLAPIWVQVSNPSGGSDMAFEVAVGPTGVYVVGYDRALGNARWRIERRSPVNGALLAAPVAINPSAGDDMAYGVAVDGTGVYVVGFDAVGGDHRWRIEKRALLGLGLIWVATSDPSGLADRPYDVAVGPTGVYVVGYDMVGGNARWRIERRSPVNGLLLAAPAISNPSPGHDYAYGVAVGPTGIYVVGTDRLGGDPRWRIEKRSLLGLGLIWAVAIDPSAGTDEARSVARDGTGIYVAGCDRVLGNLRWRIEKRTP